MLVQRSEICLWNTTNLNYCHKAKLLQHVDVVWSLVSHERDLALRFAFDEVVPLPIEAGPVLAHQKETVHDRAAEEENSQEAHADSMSRKKSGRVACAVSVPCYCRAGSEQSYGTGRRWSQL